MMNSTGSRGVPMFRNSEVVFRGEKSLSGNHSYNLKPLASCTVEQQISLLEIRNDSNVRKWMYQTQIISTSEHLEFIDRLRGDTTRLFLNLLDENGTPAGALIFSKIDTANSSADWAFYIRPGSRRGLGYALECAALEISFRILDIEKLHCEVLESNHSVISMHEGFGFQKEGFRPNSVRSAGERIGSVLMGISRSQWILDGKAITEETRKRLQGISIVLELIQAEEDLISQIQRVRARNNVNWMNILRSALETSPDSASALIREIRQLDLEIGDLTKRLASLEPKESDKPH